MVSGDGNVFQCKCSLLPKIIMHVITQDHNVLYYLLMEIYFEKLHK